MVLWGRRPGKKAEPVMTITDGAVFQYASKES